MKKMLFTGTLCATVLMASALPALAAETMPVSPAPSTGLITPATPSYTVELDGALIDLKGLAPYEKAGHVMIPVRTVAEALGFTVAWDQETQGVTVDNGTIHTSIILGVDSYSRTSSTALGLGKPQSIGVPPEALHGSTYVPAELFTILDYTVSTENGVVSIQTTDSSKTELPNPLTHYESIDAAKAALSFDAKVPTAPNGYEMTGIDTIQNTTLQITYAKGDEKITFRTAQSTEDISGNYNTYPDTDTRTVNGLTVTVKGEGDTVSQANWNDGGIAYSLTFSSGVSVADVEAIITSII